MASTKNFGMRFYMVETIFLSKADLPIFQFRMAPQKSNVVQYIHTVYIKSKVWALDQHKPAYLKKTQKYSLNAQ